MWQRNYVTLSTGERVRYSLIQRSDSPIYNVRFKDSLSHWRERSTGTVKKPDAISASHRIIREEYQQVAPSSDSVPWKAAEDKLAEAMAADGKRPKTIKGYLETLAKLEAIFPSAKGPADLTDRMAKDFKTKYATGKFTRKEHGQSYGRKPKSLDSRLRTLKAVFGWFRQLHLVEANPFEDVPAPRLDRHDVRYVRPADIDQFFEWLGERFPAWEMPKLFFEVKAVTGCRLDDLCQLRSEHLQDGRLVFPADATKNRSERYATLPVDVYAALDAYKGKTYLWERYPAELVAVNRQKGYPVHRQNPVFAPERLYQWVVQIMQSYKEATGHHLTSHDFRRAAFTRAAEQDIHPKRAGDAFDVTPETMLRYYTATEKKRNSDEVLGGLADKLRPKWEGRGR
jgi:integrase